MMEAKSETLIRRRGARRMQDVPNDVLALLATGEVESANLMEWLAADMSQLARVVAGRSSDERIAQVLDSAADRVRELPILGRLKELGSAVARSGVSFDDRAFGEIAEHRSDLVRQWACYAVNDISVPMSMEQRLVHTLRFASDQNMSVREAAWMAFRPHLQSALQPAIARLVQLAHDANENVRRFAVEVSRPRSVWGAHIGELKRRPEIAGLLMEAVRSDGSRYVQLAAGNWLNDAGKSRPDWVLSTCDTWMRSNPSPSTRKIVKRGLRTLTQRRALHDSDLFNFAWPSSLDAGKGGIC